MSSAQSDMTIVSSDERMPPQFVRQSLNTPRLSKASRRGIRRGFFASPWPVLATRRVGVLAKLSELAIGEPANRFARPLHEFVIRQSMSVRQQTESAPETAYSAGMKNYALALALGLLCGMANAQSTAAYEKVALDANVLFDSDRWSLHPASRDALDDFVLRMHGLESQTVRVVGFADRIGS